MSQQNIDKVYVIQGDTKSNVQVSLRSMGLFLNLDIIFEIHKMIRNLVLSIVLHPSWEYFSHTDILICDMFWYITVPISSVVAVLCLQQWRRCLRRSPPEAVADHNPEVGPGQAGKWACYNSGSNLSLHESKESLNLPKYVYPWRDLGLRPSDR